MLLLKIWILTVVLDIVWTILMKRYYRSNAKAAFGLMINPHPWFIVLNTLLTIWNVIGLFLVLIYFFFIR